MKFYKALYSIYYTHYVRSYEWLGKCNMRTPDQEFNNSPKTLIGSRLKDGWGKDVEAAVEILFLSFSELNWNM